MKTRTAAIRGAVKQAGTLLPVVAVFLVGAGIIEGYIIWLGNRKYRRLG